MDKQFVETTESPLIKALTTPSPTLITSFSIFGIPHTSDIITPQHPQLLYKYPESFTYPLRSERFIVPRDPTIEELTSYDILKSSFKYVTLLPGETESILCVCISKKEMLRLPSDLINPCELNNDSFNEKYVTERTYCLTTTCPFINALFPILSHLLECDYEKQRSFLNSNIINTPPHHLVTTVHPIKALLEAYVQQIFRLKQPEINSNVLISIKGINYEYLRSKLCVPPTKIASSMALVGDYSLIRLFATMKVDDILNVLSVMLTGVGVILINDNITTVTSCLLGLLSLFHPFNWPGICIPYVPDKLYELYETPVPILCGGKLPQEQCKVNAYVTELDTGYFSFFTSKISKSFDSFEPNGFVLPWRSELQAQLNDVVNRHLPKKPSAIDRETFFDRIPQETIVKFSGEIMKAMDEYLYRKLQLLVVNFCTSEKDCTLSSFMVEFPKKYNATGAEFMKKFVSSQHFNEWWYQLGLNTLKVNKAPSSFL
ncbi:UDENN domain-containing protein [Entamoeba marina]